MAKTKAAYKQYWNELREKWIAFDPIGVMDDPDWPRDEYDTYVGQTLNLLAQGAALERHVRHLEQVIEGMGIELDRRKLELQAAEFIAWCENAQMLAKFEMPVEQEFDAVSSYEL